MTAHVPSSGTIRPRGRRIAYVSVDTHQALTATTVILATPDDSLHRALLGLHKAVLAAERESLERVHGTLSSSAFLQIVSDPLRYGWLKPFSELILAFEEDEEERAPAEELRKRTRDLLLPPSQKTPFGPRYLSLCSANRGSCSPTPSSRSCCDNLSLR